MSYDWTPEMRDRYDELVRAARERSVPATTHYTREEWRWCGDVGLLGLSVPESHGGSGLDALGTASAMEAFGYGYADMGLVFAAAAHLFACAMPIAEHGTAEIRQQVLPRLCDGRWIAGNAATEDEAGSDLTSLATKAVRTADGYRISGEKSFVSNGPVADVFVVYATTDPALGFLGVSAFVVERDRPGVTVCPRWPRRCCPGARPAGCTCPTRRCQPARGSARRVRVPPSSSRPCAGNAAACSQATSD
ncbi:hypothetical protein Psuf_005030 [Phytohabitans suffuscus]|uniref:Acyl-CoA dehydrogenase/oxidase N-terminal domain-containing protein n=1 Tax=Phytohabitans suffuscus TaxID=624315 RepID=A0A6F8YAW3_9ACTN|nr:acyl-CoA dehydrogenase family protein [Phytohabitans suffuscus]BCB83190.1 hypothetical protein Psuf_005030 [Phytohabitans suffuscus]